MFTLKGREQMAKAIETARRHHPKVKVLCLGSYLVRGAAGNFYTVSMKRAARNVAAVLVAPARKRVERVGPFVI